MKRTERKHLKENEIEILARQARDLVEARKREVTAAIVALVVVGAVALGYYAWRQSLQTRAGAMLAQALAVEEVRVGPAAAPGGSAPPSPSFPTEQARDEAALAKFKEAADTYPSTDAGIFARYQQAALLVQLDRPADAIPVYQQVIAHAGGNIYGEMARLGVAEAQARAGQYDQAIKSFQELVQRTDSRLPIDAVLMQLGRTYLDAGKQADARQTFSRLVEEFPDSPYTGEARQQLDSLKKT
ncbi:MAG: tetratricopeptide repeat protein [Betaproteobacteria bacterium]